MKITKAICLLRFFNKTSASVLFLEFRYFELRNIYKRNPSPIRIQIFSSELASSFIDNGAGLVLSIWFVLAVVEQSKQIYSCEANSLGVVWGSLHALLFYHAVLVKFYCDVIIEAVYAYQHFDQHLF